MDGFYSPTSSRWPRTAYHLPTPSEANQEAINPFSPRPSMPMHLMPLADPVCVLFRFCFTFVFVFSQGVLLSPKHRFCFVIFLFLFFSQGVLSFSQPPLLFLFFSKASLASPRHRRASRDPRQPRSPARCPPFASYFL